MTTDKGLTGSEKVRKLQTVLHEKAKEEPELVRQANWLRSGGASPLWQR